MIDAECLDRIEPAPGDLIGNQIEGLVWGKFVGAESCAFPADTRAGPTSAPGCHLSEFGERI